MAAPPRPRDGALLDALTAAPRTSFEGTVWRVVRHDRDPLRASTPAGRWDDGTFEVLYTSLTSGGAIAEAHYHLTRGQPIMPSKIAFHLHELRATLRKALRFESVRDLEPFGVDRATFGAMTYVLKDSEYPRTQQLAEAAHFLECDGLIVPSARGAALHAVLFAGRIAQEDLTAMKDHGPVDWAAWRRANAR